MLLGAQTSTGLQHKANECLSAHPEETQKMLSNKDCYVEPQAGQTAHI